ncbi:hypothetical protein K376_01170 [Streptomyces sp. PsTaAH-130]|nr:hypothetical protein K376_01170 [Streptomyces sp. PsTaAH-130]
MTQTTLRDHWRWQTGWDTGGSASRTRCAWSSQ